MTHRKTFKSRKFFHSVMVSMGSQLWPLKTALALFTIEFRMLKEEFLNVVIFITRRKSGFFCNRSFYQRGEAKL